MKTILITFLILSTYFVAEATSINWILNPLGEGVLAYNVYSQKNNNVPVLQITVASNVNKVSIDPYISGNRTTFYVTAVNGAGESLPSKKVIVQKH